MSSLLQDWWDGSERRELLFRACPGCGSCTFVSRPACPHCSTQMEWRESVGRGTVFVVTTVHKSTVTAAGKSAPYTIGYVELDEGFRMMTTFTAECAIGDRVTIDFVTAGERTLPVATPETP